MMWLIEFIDNFVEGADKVQANSILEAKRNLIAKIGSMEIKFKKVVKA